MASIFHHTAFKGLKNICNREFEGIAWVIKQTKCLKMTKKIYTSKFIPDLFLDSVRKTIYELDDEIRGINVKDEDKARFAQTSLFRAQIKELIHQRQDLKEELQQTLKRLVLNRVPLPDIDGNLCTNSIHIYNFSEF